MHTSTFAGLGGRSGGAPRAGRALFDVLEPSLTTLESELPDSEAVRALESRRGIKSNDSKNDIIASKTKRKKVKI
jgi:hypothetical protein